MYTIKIVRGNIVNVTTEAIVNSANNNLMPGAGSNKMIFYAAGDKLVEACSKIGYCETGKAVYTSGFNIPAKYIIHAVGPYWHGGFDNEAQKLASCYISIMRIAESLGLKSIAMPALCTGRGGYPLDESIDIAVSSVVSYLQSHNLDMEVWFMCYDHETLLRYRAKNMEGVNDVSKYFARKEIKIDTKLNNDEKSLLRKKLFKKEITKEQELAAVNAVLKRVIRKKYPDCVYLPAPKKKENISMKTCDKYDRSGPFITMDCVEEYSYDKDRMKIRVTPYSFVDTPDELESKKRYFSEDAQSMDVSGSANKSSYSEGQKVIQVVNIESILNGIESGEDVDTVNAEYVNATGVDVSIADISDAKDELLKTALEHSDSENILVDENALVDTDNSIPAVHTVVETDDYVEITEAEDPVIEEITDEIEDAIHEIVNEEAEETVKNISKFDNVQDEKTNDQSTVEETFASVEKVSETKAEEVETVTEEPQKVVEKTVSDETEDNTEIVDYNYSGESYEIEDNEVDVGYDVTAMIEKDASSPKATNSNKSGNKNSSPNNNNKYKKSKKDYRPNYKPNYKKYGKK